jgi:hypothetical protein
MVETTKYKPTDVIAKLGEQTKLLGEYGERIRPKVGDDAYNLILNGQAKLMESFSQQNDARGDKVASTQGQTKTCGEAMKLLNDFRQAIIKAFPKDNATKEEFGIGMPVRSRSAESIHTAFERFITAAEATPEKAAAALLSAEDIARMKELRDKLVVSRANQTGMKTSAKASTLARKQLQADIETAMAKVVTAATLIFSKQPEVVALFKSTLPKTHSGSRKGGKKAVSDSSPTNSTDTDPK